MPQAPSLSAAALIKKRLVPPDSWRRGEEINPKTSHAENCHNATWGRSCHESARREVHQTVHRTVHRTLHREIRWNAVKRRGSARAPGCSRRSPVGKPFQPIRNARSSRWKSTSPLPLVVLMNAAACRTSCLGHDRHTRHTRLTGTSATDLRQAQGPVVEAERSVRGTPTRVLNDVGAF
jgi:hypothetical protein